MSNGNNAPWWEKYETGGSNIDQSETQTTEEEQTQTEGLWWEKYEQSSIEAIKKKKEKEEEEEGFNLFTAFTDSFDAIVQGGKVGLTMADTTDEFSQIMRSGGDSSKEEIQDAFEAIQKINNAPPIEAMEEWGQAYDRYIEKGDNAIQATYKATTEAGTDGFLGVMSQSVASLSNKETLAAAGVGAGAGIFFSPAGAIAGGFATANAYSESVNRFSQNMQAAIRDSGKEINSETIEEFLNNEDLFESVRMKSMAAGATIGVIEGAATLVGGKAFSAIGRAAKGATSVGGKLATKGSQGIATAAIEGAGGSLGEASAMAIEGRGFDTKEIIIEGIAGLGGAPKTAVAGGFSALNTKAGAYKVNGGKASREEILEILKSDKITDAEKSAIDIDVKNDDDLYSQVNELYSDVEIKSELDDRVTDQADRDKLFNLEKQAKNLENKKTVSGKNQLSEIKSEIKEITDKYKDVDRRTKAVKDISAEKSKIKKGIRDRRVKKDIAFVKSFGAQERSFDNGQQILDDVDKLNKTLPKDQQIKISEEQKVEIDSVGGIYDAANNIVYINKSVAANMKNTVGAHEVLHGILFRHVGDASKQKTLVDNFKTKLSDKQKIIVDNLMKDREYDMSLDSNGNRSSEYYNEYLTNFSDALNIKDGKYSIKFEENLFTKLGDLLTPILRAAGFKKISFDSGQGVYNFMKEYNKSIEKGEFTEDLSSFIGKQKTLSQEELNKVQDNISFSKDIENKINKTVGERDSDGNYVGVTKEQWDSGKGDRVIGEIYPDLQNLVTSVIDKRRLDRLPDFSREDFISDTIMGLISHIRNFNPEKKLNEKTGLSGWINSQLNNKSSTVLSSGKVTSKTFNQPIGEDFDVADESSEVGLDIDKPKQEVPKKKGILLREVLGIEEGTGLYKKILDSVTEDFENNFLNYFNQKTNIINPQVWEKLRNKFKKEFTSDIKSKIFKGEKPNTKKGRQNLVDFLKSKQNIKLIFEKLDVKELVILEKGLALEDRIFTDKVKSNLSPKETQNLKDKAVLRSKTNTQSPDLFMKKQTPPTPSQILSFFTSKDVTQQTRSDRFNLSLVESLSNALALDAYHKILSDPEISKYASNEIVSEGVISQIKTEIRRDNNNINFAKAIKLEESTDTVIDLTLTDQEVLILKKKDGLSVLNKVRLIAKRIDQELRKEKNTKTSEQLLEEEKNKKDKINKEERVIVFKILDILEKVNQIRNDRVGGIIQEITIFNLIKLDNSVDPKNRKITLLKGTAMNDNTRPDIQIHYKGHVDSKGKQIIVGIEVKKDFGADFGGGFLVVDKDGKISLKNVQTNNQFLLSAIDRVLIKNNQLENFFNFLEDKGEKINRTIGKITGQGPKDIISEKSRKAWSQRNKKVYKLGGTFKNEDINLEAIGEYYLSKGNSYMEVAGSGLFYLGTSVNDKANFINAPLLSAQKNLDVSLVTYLKFDSKKNKEDKLIGYTYRLRTELKINVKKGTNKPKSNVTIINEEGINKNVEEKKEKSNVSLSKDLSKVFNDIVEQTKDVDSKKRYSAAAAKAKGGKIGKYKFFVPPSAEDFMGLIYSFLGKGELGNKQKDFFESFLNAPYKRGVAAIDSARQKIHESYKRIKKENEDVVKKLSKTITGSDFTYDQAIRVYIWKKAGVDLSKTELSSEEIDQLSKTVESDQGLMDFANQLESIPGLDNEYPSPGEFWQTENISSDLNSFVEKIGRKKFLKEFIENKEEIFSKENLNKIEAIYGSNFREALEDSLFRMENGTNRNFGKNRIVNQWSNWINNSVGAIMFLNMRSALLQTISSVNFLNWNDNNPLQAGLAFANQKQFWTDFVTLYESDKLKQRRSGLKIDINQAELVNAVSGSKNKAKSALNHLLKLGFTPTQIADSFAISIGGASMYRNRINTYKKQGMSTQEAEQAAFEDFSAITEETQQSSDPSLISQQQSGPMGRLILAFANTPMQYARLTKKAALDLIYKRGDFNTNLSKLIYYAAVQNIIFNGMQTALFAMMFDDDAEEEEIDKKEFTVLNGMLDSLLRGAGIGGAAVAALKNGAMKYYEQKDKKFGKDHASWIVQLLRVSPPLGSKVEKLYSAARLTDYEKDVIAAKGFSLDSPIYEIGGKTVSAFTNLPLDRAVIKLNNLAGILNEDAKTWQKIGLALGWDDWVLGLENQEHELIKANAKDSKRKEKYRKSNRRKKEGKSLREKERDKLRSERRR
tara:strand:+ start:2533 stop:9147 length:6615 start_codon:yes stop_codon:yes gene_type:complete